MLQSLAIAFGALIVVVTALTAAPQDQARFSKAVEQRDEIRKDRVLTATAVVKTETATVKTETQVAKRTATSTPTPGRAPSYTATVTPDPKAEK